MSEHLVLMIRLHDTRYHGVSEWPPAPARVFQALLSGAAHGKQVPEETQRALSWLEQQPPPLVAAPYMREGQSISSFVPNNDADSLGGDLSRIGDIRAQKTIAPRLIASTEPFVYAWPFKAPTAPVEGIEATAEKLYQFGRGVDMAWASAEVMSEELLASYLSTYRGSVHRPTPGGAANALACPTRGSLQSLMVRYEATIQRLRTEGEGRSATCLFVQPPKPRFAQVSYDSPSPSRVFRLLRAGTDTAYPWRLRDVAGLVERIRDVAAHKLCEALPRLAGEIHGSLIGKGPGETNAVGVKQRVRIVPLPSIGHKHADRAIRRVLVDVPHGCPLPPEDVFWALSGQLFDTATGEFEAVTLIPAQDDDMRSRYERASRRFRSVSPAALPESTKRRRIDPARKYEERKLASERIDEEQRATAAVHAALRHAGVRVQPAAILVQREPFESKGARAECFAPGTRFEKERLWHIEIRFAEPVSGPLVIGNGRFLGLGLMVPVPEVAGIHVFAIEGGLVHGAAAMDVASALRRAVMARVAQLGVPQPLPPFFSGHESSGAPARAQNSPHLTFAFDVRECRILVLPPHVTERRPARSEEREQLRMLDEALRDLTEIRAGAAGVLRVGPTEADTATDHLFRPTKFWESVTEYHVTRHEKGIGAHAALAKDLRVECRRRGLPEPSVAVIDARGVRGQGLAGRVKLTFPTPVRGPLLLGRSRYLGGGLFAAASQ